MKKKIIQRECLPQYIVFGLALFGQDSPFFVLPLQMVIGWFTPPLELNSKVGGGVTH